MNPSNAEILPELGHSIRGCTSWHDLPKTRKGDLFENLVKAYLQLEPEYASKPKHVWLQREVPQAIVRKPILPAAVPPVAKKFVPPFPPMRLAHLAPVASETTRLASCNKTPFR